MGHFPEDRWYSYSTLDEVKHIGLTALDTSAEEIPVFIRGGHIIPRKDRLRRSTQMMKRDPYTIVVALDKDLKAAGDLYIDDGISFDYTDDHYILGTFTFESSILSYKVRHPGSVDCELEIERITLIGIGQVNSITVFMGEAKWEVGFYRYNNGAIVMKLPQVTVDKEWKIKLN